MPAQTRIIHFYVCLGAAGGKECEVIMRLVLRTILFPVILIMSIMLAFSKFIVSISGVVLGVIAFLVTLGSLACFVQNDPVTGIQALIIAFLLSPYGLPKIAIWIIAYLEYGKDRLKEI